MKPWLSILIPSINPDGLARFLSSLGQNLESARDEIEFIIDKEPGGMGEVYSRMLEKAQGEWIWIANDDLICETASWLYHFKQATKKFDDGIALIYPNDKLFEESFCCFPLIRKELIKDLFPMSFKKYKVDDSIMSIIPKNRYIYLDNVVMRHLNFNVTGHPGFLTKTGKVYPVDTIAAQFDTELLKSTEGKRLEIKRKILAITEPNRPEKRILIGGITAEYARRADFYDYYNAMIKPMNSIATFAHGQSPAENRNIIIEQAFQSDVTHILFLDDDIAFQPNMLLELMKHDLDIVSGLMLKRNYPHVPLILWEAQPDGRCKHRPLFPGEKGLIEVDATGLGCCLISMDVFRALEKPYIRLGELDGSGWNDDIGFFKRVREAGFKIHCDLDIKVGHIASMILWPDKINDQWMTTYDTYGQGKASVPQLLPEKELV